MSRCEKLVDIGRRQFLRGGALAAAGAATAIGLPQNVSARVQYPSSRIRNIAELALNESRHVSYPDNAAPGVLLKLGRKVEGGAGPDGDIVGFSTICPHKGFPLVYDGVDRALSCPGHYSRFDCEAGGQQVWGHATQNLPQYVFPIDAKGSEHVTCERLRNLGTNGFQEPAVGFKDGRSVGTQRLYANGVFDTEDGKARFIHAAWRGLQAPGKQAQRDKHAFLINNGRANLVWQSAYLDVENDFVIDRWPFPFIEIHPDDMAKIGVKQGDLVEIYNDVGSTQAIAYPTPTARPGETFMLFAYPTGVQGNVVNAGTNELVIPNYKQTWGNIRKIADAPASMAHLSFKSKHYAAAE